MTNIVNAISAPGNANVFGVGMFVGSVKTNDYSVVVSIATLCLNGSGFNANPVLTNVYDMVGIDSAGHQVQWSSLNYPVISPSITMPSFSGMVVSRYITGIRQIKDWSVNYLGG